MNDAHAQTYDLNNFTIQDMTTMGKFLRKVGEGASSMEDTAGRITGYLYDSLIDGSSGIRACSLARLFLTIDYGKLTENLRKFAGNIVGTDSVLPDMKCLTLMGTKGEIPEWDSRDLSIGHQAIPLPSEDAVMNIPMLRNMIQQFGLDIKSIIKPDPELMLDMDQKTYNVFFVPEAAGSPFIPAQDEFVVPRGVKSVLGFGGLFPTGDMFVVIMFLKVPLSKEVTEFFRSLSLNVKIALLPFEDKLFN